jgi:adenylate cyclase
MSAFGAPVYRNFKAALIAGLLLGILGLVLTITPYGFLLEENFGLYVLFHLRGPRPVPPDVVVIALDQESAESLDLPSNPLKWPRRLHATLTDYLAQRGASVIAFDILFSETTTEEDDNRLAGAIGKAANVVLCEYLKREIVPLAKGVSLNETMYLEKMVPPTELIANAASALAPFPLPKVPNRVGRFWTFKTEAGSKPTLPFVAFQLYSIDLYKEFVLLLESVSPEHSGILPEKPDAVSGKKGIASLVSTIRSIFEENPWIPNEMLKKLHSDPPVPANGSNRKNLEALINAYRTPDSLFLNFYGPPGTIPNIAFHRIVKNGRIDESIPDIRGKAVFVGLSDVTRPEQRDGFNTVFSRSDGTDLSGVEIAATAFANLLEGMPVRPAPPLAFLGINIIFGVIAGIGCFLFPTFASATAVTFTVIAFTALAELLFQKYGLWLPMVVPFAVLAPLAFLGSVLHHHADSKKEREHIRKAFGFFLPDTAIDQIISDMKTTEDIATSRQTVFGTVLCSDGAQYTSLSESMSPKELGLFLNKYYEAIFRPVKANSGAISDIIGDSMLAVWTRAHPDIAQKRGACHAALGIMKAVDDFNDNSEHYKLHTRIGLHYGQLLLGNVGGLGHYEYRPVGDVVNTASRMEGLNKHFGTRILVSEALIEGVDDFLTREMGCFLLAGKSNPITIFELISTLENTDTKQQRLSAIFSQALRNFETRLWDEAEALFNEYLRLAGRDEPSLYYLKKCEVYRRNPPGELWDGVLYFGK